MNNLTSTSISVKGDRHYAKLLKFLAAKKGITMADLVRDALDEKYAEELRPLEDFFDVSSVAQKHQSELIDTEKVGA